MPPILERFLTGRIVRFQERGAGRLRGKQFRGGNDSTRGVETIDGSQRPELASRGSKKSEDSQGVQRGEKLTDNLYPVHPLCARYVLTLDGRRAGLGTVRLIAAGSRHRLLDPPHYRADHVRGRCGWTCCTQRLGWGC